MDYLINQIIHFDSANGLINLIENENSTIQLSKPGSRLLTELITNCGNTMTREELLQLVWEEHGLRPSGSSLSNHISLLRKVFSQLGMNENIIITIPKKGFRLDAEVTLTQLHHHIDDDNIFNVKKENETPHSTFSCEHILTPEIKKVGLASIIIISFIVTFFILSRYSLNSVSVDSFDIGTCRMIDLAEDKKGNRAEKYKTLVSLIYEKKIDCKKSKSTIYFRFSNFFPMKNYDKSAVFLTQCHQKSNNRLTQCESYLSDTVKKP